MDHLLYNPLPRAFRIDVRDATKLLSKDHHSASGHRQSRHGRHEPPTASKYLRVPWLGHDHASSSYFCSPSTGNRDYNGTPLVLFTDHYGRSWKVDEALRSGDLRLALSNSKGLDVQDIIHQVAAFLQSHLSLGLTEAIVQSPVPASAFVDTDFEGRQWMYTGDLPGILEAWRRMNNSFNHPSSHQMLIQARDCVILANTMLADLQYKLTGPTVPDSFRQLHRALLPIQPGIASLHEAFIAFMDLYVGGSISTINARTDPFPHSYSENLLTRGWCPFVIANAEYALEPSLLRYVDLMGYEEFSGGHEGCGVDVCSRNQLDLNTYAQKHVEEHCTCRFVKPDLTHVFEILDAGLFPVVRIEPESFARRRPRLELGGSAVDDESADFIVFSHVWADGLGSCSEDGLPICQVKRLDRLASSYLTFGSWFWIDSLCVPKREPYRDKAIQRMKSTYWNATGAIVLDSGLQRAVSSALDIELAWRLYASGWVNRLWTYQEGYLPFWVLIELGDGTCNMYALIRRLYDLYFKVSASGTGNPFPALFTRGLLSSLQKLRPLDSSYRRRPGVRKIVDVFNALTRRCTSRPDDQILVLGLLLDLDVSLAMALREEERWRSFYITLKDMPWTIVFDRRPKLSKAPFRWAPSSWLSIGRDEYLDYEEEVAICDENGLHVDITVLQLESPVDGLGGNLIISMTLGETTANANSQDEYPQEQDDEDGESNHEVSGSDAEIYLLSHTQNANQNDLGMPFDTVLVRHFKYETPEQGLLKNDETQMRVGVAQLRSHTFGLMEENLECPMDRSNFQSWSIRRIWKVEDGDKREHTSISGRWARKRLAFT